MNLDAQKVVRILIVEDEVLAAQKLQALVKELRGFEIVGHSGSGCEALGAIKDLSPDLLLLDIQLPDMTGFAILDQLRESITLGSLSRIPHVVFITAHDDYAIRAFQVHAVDYLLKPFDKGRLHEALERVRQYLISDSSLEFAARLIDAAKDARLSGRYARRLVFKSDGHLVVLRVNDIRWAQAQGNYIRVYSGVDSYLLRETMQKLENHLDPEVFLRIHRSMIVNLDEVSTILSTEGEESVVKLRDGTQLKMSRAYRARALARFNSGIEMDR